MGGWCLRTVEWCFGLGGGDGGAIGDGSVWYCFAGFGVIGRYRASDYRKLGILVSAGGYWAGYFEESVGG